MNKSKDVLDYSDAELEELSTEELRLLLEEAEIKERQSWTAQTGLKIVINSLYGALSNKYFPLFNERMAQAVTGNGRFFIQLLAKNVEGKLQSMIPAEAPYMVYGDTDSCIGSTLVQTNEGQIKIEDLYELKGSIETRGEDNFINHLDYIIDGASASSDLKLEYKPIKYVMKHKVKKRMFRISVGDESVVVTEDHSVMVVRDGSLRSVKPQDIHKTDKLIKIE